MAKDIYYINVKESMPNTAEANNILLTEIHRARELNYPITKIIHGWGSHGVGGALRNDIRLKLRNLIWSGELTKIIYGEDWDVFNSDVYDLLIKYPSLGKEHDLFCGNIGVTIAVINIDSYRIPITVKHMSNHRKNKCTHLPLQTAAISLAPNINVNSTEEILEDIPGKFKYKVINCVSGSILGNNFTGQILIQLYYNTLYKGSLKDNIISGTGEIILPNNIFYKGDFRRGLADGKGKLLIKDKEFSGKFHNNKFIDNLEEDVLLNEALLSLKQGLYNFNALLCTK